MCIITMPSEACNHRDTIYIDYAPDINLGGKGGWKGGREGGRQRRNEGGREGRRERSKDITACLLFNSLK